MMQNQELIHICPVCGEHNFSKKNSQEKCPVCGWVDDAYQTEHIFVRNMANRFSLAQSKKAWHILNLDYEVGYGMDNALWGCDKCYLCDEKICIDECKYKIQKLLKGEKPAGVDDIEKAKGVCTRCILRTHKSVEDWKTWSKMAKKPSGWDTYGNEHWGAGSDEYDVDEYQENLQSLVHYCHTDAPKEKFDPSPRPEDPNFDEQKECLMQLMSEDEEARRNFYSYFFKPLLSIADFIEYAKNEDGVLDSRFSLWAFGKFKDEKYEFTPMEKKKAEKVLHISLSFLNYRCEQYGDPGLYYLDNAYEGWEPHEFDDAIAAWFVDIGDELDEDALKEFIIRVLKEGFSYSHVKLVLHFLTHLDYAKDDAELQKLLKLYGLVSELQPLVAKCIV